jgi:transcriptional regulator of acetoin/glycerol metabolism
VVRSLLTLTLRDSRRVTRYAVVRVKSTLDDVSGVEDGDVPGPPVVVLVTPEIRVFALDGELALGRRIDARGAQFELADERVSREHATVRLDHGAWVIVDRGSHNGTFVDGQRVTGEVRRRGDCVVRLGHSVFLLVRDGRGYDPLPPDDGDQVIGPELARAYDQVRRHAQDPTLVVHGESGSGKELVARLYHASGPRSGGPFVAVNCAAIPEGVAERLLFGARKGAYSGAQDATGYLQSAHGGTLFLDEIAELDLAVQPKLLRALEMHEVTPVGANAPIAIDLGVVAASHRDLRAEVAAGRFRDDLYYRLARATLHLAPLRERKLDIARLVVRELAAVDRRLEAHARVIELCCTRPWPGNVRELRNAIRIAAGAARAAGRDVVRADDLPPDTGLPVAGASPPRAEPAGTPQLDADTVRAALAQANGVVSVAARGLGLHRTQLYRLMEKLGIERPS